jgi:hypothetical protein
MGGASALMFTYDDIKRSPSVKAAKPVKDIELALREVLDQYTHEPKTKLLGALEQMTEEVSDEHWPEKSGAAGDDDSETSEEGTD